MTLHVCVLGIDGSGKSTVVSALPCILAAESGLNVGSAGDSFSLVAPDEDHMAVRFYPDGIPITARMSMQLKAWAKKFVDQPKIYTVFKLAQMLVRDSAAQKLSRRYSASVFVSDGNALLSTTGRAANYLRAASTPDHLPAATPEAEDLGAVFSYILDDQPVPLESRQKLPSLRKAKLICKLNNLFRLNAVWLPDVIIFLDIAPEIALKRIKSRGKKIDRHENLADLGQTREMYLKALRAVQLYRGHASVHCVRVDHLTLGETLQAVVDVLKLHLRGDFLRDRKSDSPLGTSALPDAAIRKKTLNHQYFFRYLLPKWFKGAWREPTFFLSKLGRLFLKEGYSAGVMRVIYDRDDKKYGLLDGVFLEYSLHRAVYDRLQILVNKLGPELEARLANDGHVRVFTAPSGFAYDLFRPLEDIARRDPTAMRRVHVIAVDLDPHSILAEELTHRASRLGVDFTFQQGDLTDPRMRSRFEQLGPFDLALFVGLSSWLPKPETLLHIAWLQKNLRDGGRVITDCFTPDAYALSGRYIGYKANYYSPEVYGAMLDYCGFDGLNAERESGRDAINHVFVTGPRPTASVSTLESQTQYLADCSGSSRAFR
jgi:Thymidylate kinase